MNDVRPDGSGSTDEVADDVDGVDAVETVTYDAEADVYRVSTLRDYPEPFAYVLVEAVAAVTGRDAEALEPLHDAIDAEAVGVLLSSNSDVTVAFEFAGCEIKATGDGEIVIRAPPGR